jgi:transcriptional regulator with XRE-family HTH domain
MDTLADQSLTGQRAAMLTGNQLAAARRLAGIGTQADLATKAGVGRATVERAEQARDEMPNMRTDQLVQIIVALEAAGVEFYLAEGASLAGGLGMRLRRKP